MPGSYDFAIVGSSTLSLLLCGLLVRDQGARVVRIGRRPSAERLPRGPDLALMAATRPETWQILREGDAEIRRLFTSMGAPLLDVEAEIVIDTERTRAAFDHIAHLASGYRQSVRRIAGGWSFRGVTMLPPQAASLSAWLDGMGVDFIDADATPLAPGGNLANGIEGVEANLIVFADDDFSLELDATSRPSVLRADAMTMTLLDRAPARDQTLLRLYPDRQVALIPRDQATTLARIRHSDALDERLASVLSAPFPIRRLATARYRVLASQDGAPVIGPIKPSGPFLIAGLEVAAPFFAPIVARALKGKATNDETSWLATHDPARPVPVIEFAP
jgi:hypothetical protein